MNSVADMFRLVRLGPDDQRVHTARDPQTTPPNDVTGTRPGDAINVVQMMADARMQPHPALYIAEQLAHFGKFGPDNPEGTRQIIATLTAVARTMPYALDRNKPHHNVPQSPDTTVRINSGQCQDIHALVSAIIASLADLQPNGAPGSPSGKHEVSEARCYASTTEQHCYSTFKADKTWDALEYAHDWGLAEKTSLDAVMHLGGSSEGSLPIQINGWDQQPTIFGSDSVGAAATQDYFAADPRTGTAGETRISADARAVQATYFLTKHLSANAMIDPSSFGIGIRAGAKLNYHTDFKNGGYARIAGGMYKDAYEARDGVERPTREHYDVYNLGVQSDLSVQRGTALLGEHLKLSGGLDAHSLLVLPLADHNTKLGMLTTVHLSSIDVAAQAGLRGKETSGQWSLKWDAVMRGRVDVMGVGMELYTSSFTSVSQSLGKEPWRVQGALEVDYAHKLTLDLGGTVFLFDAYDPAVTPRATQYGTLTVSPTPDLQVGVAARADTLDAEQLSSAGVAARWAINKHTSVGAVVEGARSLPGSPVDLNVGVTLMRR